MKKDGKLVIGDVIKGSPQDAWLNEFVNNKSKNVTQVELARRLVKPQSYVSKVEVLERRIDVIELIDWLNALDKKTIEFISQLNN